MHGDDIDLLREFSAGNSEEAFATLVRRHINLVYSVARRRLNNPHAAEEVTQAVFIILAAKAGSLRPGTILSGWLYQAAQFTSANFERAAARRQAREQEACMQFVQESEGESPWRQLSPLLEEAMTRLGRNERDAVVLRFFENRSIREVAAALGLQEAAAQKRVNRATEKLRKFFMHRGVPISTAALLGCISANVIRAAPAELASKIAALAAMKGALAGASTLALVKPTLKLMAWTKLKTGVIGLVVAAGVATPWLIQHQANARLKQENQQLRRQMEEQAQSSNEALARAQVDQNEINRLRQEHSELLHLRSANNRKPIAQTTVPATAPHSQVATPAPESSGRALPKESWTNAGFASPEAALQTRGWAVLNGSRERFKDSVYITDNARKALEDMFVQMANASTDPNKDQYLQEIINNKFGVEEAILMPMMGENQNHTYTGYQILSQQSSSPDEAILEVETTMASAPAKKEKLKFRRFDGDWKVVIDDDFVKSAH
jgi:RNA polymerase sigma factor (sigma-70 family)